MAISQDSERWLKLENNDEILYEPSRQSAGSAEGRDAVTFLLALSPGSDRLVFGHLACLPNSQSGFGCGLLCVPSAGYSADPLLLNQAIQKICGRLIALLNSRATIISCSPSATRHFVHLFYRDETKYVHPTILNAVTGFVGRPTAGLP